MNIPFTRTMNSIVQGYHREISSLLPCWFLNSWLGWTRGGRLRRVRSSPPSRRQHWEGNRHNLPDGGGAVKLKVIQNESSRHPSSIYQQTKSNLILHYYANHNPRDSQIRMNSKSSGETPNTFVNLIWESEL